MSSNKPFVFNVDKLNKFALGDIGIADTIYKAQIEPILNTITDEQSKAMFINLSKPDKKSGLWAFEKTVISSMLESQKPFIELIKICLELFGSIEHVITILLGGSNPLNDSNSFSGAFKVNQAKMLKFKTGLDTKKTEPNPNQILPLRIFLGEFQRDALIGNVYSLNSQPLAGEGEFTIGHDWQQYQNYNNFYDLEYTKLQNEVKDVPEDIKPDIIQGRFNSINDEWSAMQTDNQITKTYGNLLVLPDNISKYFIPQETQYLNKTITIDPENDYNLVVRRTVISPTKERFYIYGILKNDNQEESSNQPAQPSSYYGIIADPTSIIVAVKTFIKSVLPIITKKLIPVIIALQKIISKPVEFIGNILMTKLKEHYQLFDPSIKGTPNGDKYWSGNNFVLDGVAVLDIGLLKMTLGLKKGLPTFKAGKDPISPDTKEQPLLKAVTNLVALPINFLKGILDAFKDLMKKLLDIKKLPEVFTDFTTFKWIKDLLALPKLMEFLGASGNLNDGTFKIPFFTMPTGGNMLLVPEMIKGFIKMIIHFINGFISIPNTIMNIELVPKIPIPS